MKKKISLGALLVCFAAMTYGSLFFYPKWNKERTESIISYDVEGYYWYLPSIFIYRNIKTQHFEEGVLSKLQSNGTEKFEYGYVDSQSGNYILKYTCGMSVMYAPAFMAGHIAAKTLGYDANGFSAPYKLSLQIWGLLFAFLGLLYLRKLLKIFYADKIVAAVLLLLVFGSNYFNYAAIDIGMSHSWLFTLYVFIILNSHYYYNTLHSKYVIRLGVLIGLVTLIRPTEMMAAMIPLLWGIDSFGAIKTRLLFLLQKWKLFLLVVLCALAVVSVQLFYWHYVSGKWFVYSYQNQEFDFTKPHFFDFSWSYRAGWLRYSPMMILCFAGIFPFLKNGKNRFAIIIFFLFSYYIVCAWNIWDYGGFSGRAMIQTYPVMLFTLASLIEYANRPKIAFYVLIPIMIFFVYMNVWWTYQAHRGNLVDAFCTTKEYYNKVVGRWSVPEDVMKLKDTDELPEHDFQDKKLVFERKTADTLNADKQNAILLDTTFSTHKEWVRVDACYHSFSKEWDVWKMPQLIVKFKSDTGDVKTRILRLHRFLDYDQQDRIFLDVKVPATPFNELEVNIWNGSSNTSTEVSDLKVWEMK